MAKLTLTDIGIGAAPGDGTGDPARTGGGSINSNNTAIENAINELASRQWEIDNTTATLALGEQCMCTSHAGITKTLPAATAIVTDDYNHIMVCNFDTNSNVTIDPNGSEEIFFEGATLGAGVAYTLSPGYMALLVLRASGDWNLAEIPMKALTVSDLDDVTIGGSLASGDLLKWNGSAWITNTLEEADAMERSVPATESTPFVTHSTKAARASGTENIDCENEPSVYLPIGGNSVTINLDVPALSLPERGLADVKLAGKVFVKMNGAYSGLTVTTDAGTTIGTFPKGTAPSANGEYAVLVWEWFDDGTTDFMWAEWVNDA
jgi:hypothetical protein